MLLALVLGCSTSPDGNDLYHLHGLAGTADSSTGRNSLCQLSLALQHFGTLARGFTATADVRVIRQIYPPTGSEVSRDTTLTGIPVAVDLGENDSLRVILGGVVAETLFAGRSIASNVSYTGFWTCGTDLPLGQDSILQAHDYQNVPQSGHWTIELEQPVG